MKTITLFLFLTLSIFTLQAQNVEGTYANKWISEKGEGMAYTLTLQDDGTFTFYYTRKYIGSHPDKNEEIRGNWNLDGHLLVLNTNEEESTDPQFAAELNANKARFVSISPRHPKFNLVNPTLEFFRSDVFYLKGMELIKSDQDITSTDSATE